MTTPHIRIELDPGEWTDPKWEKYRLAGGRVSGKVIVDCPGPLSCEAIRCVVGWHTEGRGDRDDGMIAVRTLHKGSLETRRSFDFQVELPVNGPISYAGHYINIVWTVTAIIDLSWKKNPQAQETFYLMPAPVTL